MTSSVEPRRRHERRHRYWDLHDFSVGRGLEIGPLHRTIVPRSEADVRYLDVLDRTGLVEHYRDDPAVDAALIPEIDYTLIGDDGQTASLTQAVQAGVPFSWVVASHVIEHVPDVIGWLAELADVVEDDARLVLAVPDRRYCFDVLRPPTTVGQMIQAHRDGDTRPSVRAVYDYFTSVVQGDAQMLWAGLLPAYHHRYHSTDEADQKTQDSADGVYVDCHVWLFTPQSLVRQMHELRTRGRSSWVVTEVESTPRDDLEFKVVLRRLPRGSDPTGVVSDELLPSEDRPDWTEPLEVERLRARVLLLESRLEQRRATVARIRQRVRRTKARKDRRIARLERELARVRSSRQWRLGGMVLRPVRAARTAGRR